MNLRARYFLCNPDPNTNNKRLWRMKRNGLGCLKRKLMKSEFVVIDIKFIKTLSISTSHFFKSFGLTLLTYTKYST